MEVVLKLLAFESLLFKNEWSIKQASKGAKADGGIQQMKTLTRSFPSCLSKTKTNNLIIFNVLMCFSEQD